MNSFFSHRLVFFLSPFLKSTGIFFSSHLMKAKKCEVFKPFKAAGMNAKRAYTNDPKGNEPQFKEKKNLSQRISFFFQRIEKKIRFVYSERKENAQMKMWNTHSVEKDEQKALPFRNKCRKSKLGLLHDLWLTISCTHFSGSHRTRIERLL